MRAVLSGYVVDEDPGEPEYVEAVESALRGDGGARWRYRDRVVAGALIARAACPPAARVACRRG